MDETARDLQRLLAAVGQGANNQGPADVPARDEGSVRGKFFFLPGGVFVQYLVRLLRGGDNRPPTDLSLTVVPV